MKTFFTKTVWIVAFVVVGTINIAKAQVIASGVCGTSNNLIWELTSDGTLSITGSGQMKDYLLEDATPWASYVDDIKTVILPNGLTSIGKFAFALLKIPAINIPNTVTVIAASAFWECRELRSVTIPNSVQRLNDYTFIRCNKLTKVVLGSSVERLNYAVFLGCTALDTVICKSTTPPTFNTFIGTHSFQDVDQLVKIIVPCNKGFDYKASDWGDKFGLSNIVEDCIIRYAVTVIDGAGSGDYPAGQTVSITATIPNGKQFKEWTSTSTGVSFANATSANTTFTMPANAVTVTANFETAGTVINENVLNAKIIYPNPTKGQLIINNEQLSIDNVEIYDVIGQLLYQINKSTNKQINNEISIDISHLASGVYIVRLFSGTREIGYTKIIKE